MMDGVSVAIVGLVAGLCVVPVVVMSLLMAGTVRRLLLQNEIMLKANLALSEKPSAIQQGLAMEMTDRIEAESARPRRPPISRPVGA